MKHLQFILPIIALLLFTACEKDIYHDHLLSNTEVEEYGYMRAIAKDDDFPLSDMKHTHRLNLHIPLVYEGNVFNEKFVHIKGRLYNDELSEMWQTERIRVSTIEELQSLPFKQLPPIDYYPFMEEDSYKIINSQEEVDSIISKLNPITDYMRFPENIEEWRHIDFDKYNLIVARSSVAFSDKLNTKNPQGYKMAYNSVVPFVINKNDEVECLLFSQNVIYYSKTGWTEQWFLYLIGILVDKSIDVKRVTFKPLKSINGYTYITSPYQEAN